MGRDYDRFFHYSTGDVAKLDDLLLTGFLAASGDRCIGRVVGIFQPQSPDAEAYDCEEEGGVLIEVDWDGAKGLVLETPPDGDEWNDYVLIRRA